MKWAVVILVVAGCRLSINKWGGIPPRATDHVKVVLHDNGGGDLGKRVLTADPRVEVIAFDPAVNEKQRTDCGNLSCPLALEPACKWAAQQGADYYAIAAQSSAFSQTTKCVRSHTDWSKAFDKNGDSEVCDESAVTAEGTRSSFSIRLYDATTCEEVPALSQQVTSYVPGAKAESETESAMQLGALAPTKYPGFPDQTMVAPDGHIVNAPGDGQYALFRARKFQGIARLHRSGTPEEHVHMLMCCEEPQPGDVLVKRGPMKLVELDVSFDTAILASATQHQGAYGAGIHLRHRHLAGGLELGLSGDTLEGSELSAGLVSINAGWGHHITSLLHLSANVDIGFAQLLQDINGESARAWTPFAMPQARAQIAVRWWYVGLDLGYAISSTVGRGDWSGEGSAMAVDARLRGPLARLYAGITL
ncbi:MAG TPA: hypothetical protein VMZ53_26465 [Kofleriaceae bacterium]|nr:hypothetical protein [Kofleriaceae bacterium]